MTGGPGVLPAAAPAGGGTGGTTAVVPLPDLGPWRPRLVATDLDGTLLTSGGALSPRTRAALDACWAAGIPVVGATGRGPRLVGGIRALLDGRGLAVLAQGGYVVDLEREEVLRAVGLPRERAAAVVAAVERAAGPVLLAVEAAAEQSGVPRPLRVEHDFGWPYTEPTDLLAREHVLPPGPVLKVFLRSPHLGPDELLARAREAVDPADAEVTHAGLGYVEVLPPGVTKATGLAVALQRYGVGPADVVAFGDMPNDLPMLEAVRAAGGRSVAVANAHPDVLAAAEHRTSGHDADGVARYLEAVLGLEAELGG